MERVSQPTVLVVDDEEAIAEAVRARLESEGYRVLVAADGPEAIQICDDEHPDLVVLDLMLPGMDGLEVCKIIQRERWIPVLMLTARTEESDKVAGFAVGADDYLTKPFELRELEARIAALHKRRGGRASARELRHGRIAFNTASLTVTVGGAAVKLPPKALKLLELLLSQPERVFSRAELETAVWGDRLPSSETLRSQMHILRRAFLHVGASDPIENVHGMGYRLAPG